MADTFTPDGPYTYAEAFALLAAGFWVKVGEVTNRARDGTPVLEIEVWFRDGAAGPEWADLSAEPGYDRGERRWWLVVFAFDPRATLSDELWEKLGPGATGGG